MNDLEHIIGLLSNRDASNRGLGVLLLKGLGEPVLDKRLRKLVNQSWEIATLFVLHQCAHLIADVPVELRFYAKWDHSVPAHLRFDRRFPHEILKLKKIKEIYWNIYVGEIPEEIGNLSYLKKLTFISAALLQVPAGIGRLPYLRELVLRSNRISKIPHEVFEIKSLKKLDLSLNPLQGLPENVGLLENLEELHLNFTQLRELPTGIGKLKKLKVLHLYETHIQYLPKEIKALTQLETLTVPNIISNQQLRELKEQLPNTAIINMR